MTAARMARLMIQETCAAHRSRDGRPAIDGARGLSDAMMRIWSEEWLRLATWDSVNAGMSGAEFETRGAVVGVTDVSLGPGICGAHPTLGSALVALGRVQ